MPLAHERLDHADGADVFLNAGVEVVVGVEHLREVPVGDDHDRAERQGEKHDGCGEDPAQTGGYADGGGEARHEHDGGAQPDAQQHEHGVFSKTPEAAEHVPHAIPPCDLAFHFVGGIKY